MPRQARLDLCGVASAKTYRRVPCIMLYAGVSSVETFLETIPIEPLSLKTRICFAKNLHALLRLGADSESFPSGCLRETTRSGTCPWCSGLLGDSGPGPDGNRGWHVPRVEQIRCQSGGHRRPKTDCRSILVSERLKTRNFNPLFLLSWRAGGGIRFRLAACLRGDCMHCAARVLLNYNRISTNSEARITGSLVISGMSRYLAVAAMSRS
jgi:hypothetical protein